MLVIQALALLQNSLLELESPHWDLYRSEGGERRRLRSNVEDTWLCMALVVPLDPSDLSKNVSHSME